MLQGALEFSLMLRLIAVLVIGGSLAGSAAGSHASDARTVQSLVVSRADVPRHWTSTINRNPCPSAVHPEVVVTSRAATRWGSPTHGIWSVAMLTRTESQSELLFRTISDRLPACLVRYWRDHYSPPGSPEPTVTLRSERLDALGDARAAWTLTLTRAKAPATTFDIVLVRKGHAVSQYAYGWEAGLTVIRRALARS